MDLISSRQIGMSAGPIWWTTIQDYCDKRGLDEEQIEAMHSHIGDMDLVYLRSITKK